MTACSGYARALNFRATFRAKRLKWCRAIIDNHTDGSVLVWDYLEGSGKVSGAITSAGSTQLGGGYMRFAQDAEFADWTLTYDEVVFVQTGELTVLSGNGNTVARAGEAILIPNGSKVTYRGRAGTLGFFVLWPFDWNKKGGAGA